MLSQLLISAFINSSNSYIPLNRALMYVQQRRPNNSHGQWGYELLRREGLFPYFSILECLLASVSKQTIQWT